MQHRCMSNLCVVTASLTAFLSTTDEMQRYTMFFIIVSVLHVSSGFSAHHQELKNCICSISTCQTCVVTASLTVFLSTTDEMQRYTMFFIIVSVLHVSSGFSAHRQELKNRICSIGTCQTRVLLSLACLSRKSTRLAITTHKFDKYRCCLHNFWATDDERKTRSKHVEHWQL
jgi:hypothetical protein